MSQRNRVTPRQEIVAASWRGMFTGNRGCLHDDGRQVLRPWRGRLWIICALEFRGRHRELWQPRRWTPLFFYDEAAALASGHRPCGECRHAAYVAFRDAWAEAHGARPSAREMNDRLRADRLDGRAQRTHRQPSGSLPDGVFVDHDDAPALVLGDVLRPWSGTGYGAPTRRPRGPVTVLTPRVTVEVLRAGYAPVIAPGLSA